MGLLWVIESYLRATGTSPSRFGREAVHDPRFVHDLRKGRSPGGNTELRVRAFMTAAWPGRRS